jgi:hypothetical protein
MAPEEMEAFMTSLQAQKEQQAAAVAAKIAETPEGETPPVAVDTTVSDEDIKVRSPDNGANTLCCFALVCVY